MKTALIIGSEGQDGTYLFEYLQKKRYNVIGIGRGKVRSNLKLRIKPIDIFKPMDVKACLQKYRPAEIYYLAAFHHSSQEIQEDEINLFKKSLHVHVHGLIHFLDGIRAYAKRTKLFYAASSHVFGNPSKRIQDEKTPLVPVCIYGITKTAGMQMCQFYRQEHGLRASVGILYNHESPLRAAKFVSQKIVKAAIAIKEGKQKELVLGNLNATIDWGYAGDYVEAMHKILQLPAGDDFIIASGETHTVKDFVGGVFKYLGLNWKKYVREDKSLIQKRIDRHLQGSYAKLHAATGWKPKTNFNELMALLVEAGGQTHDA